jgi:hypothetical protein
MTTANDRFNKKHPELAIREVKLRALLPIVRLHYDRIVNRLEKSWSDGVYNRCDQLRVLENSIIKQLRNNESKFEDFCRNTLKLY